MKVDNCSRSLSIAFEFFWHVEFKIESNRSSHMFVMTQGCCCWVQLWVCLWVCWLERCCWNCCSSCFHWENVAIQATFWRWNVTIAGLLLGSFTGLLLGVIPGLCLGLLTLLGSLFGCSFLLDLEECCSPGASPSECCNSSQSCCWV